MIGQNIGQYRILEKLGEGGMGVVYKAHDTRLDRLVALKFLPPHAASSDTEQARFVQEARTTSALNHPNVCIIYDFQAHPDRHFIVMELVEGVTLKQRVPLNDFQMFLEYAVQIGEALQAAHARGIIHRDIKCDNIMVTSEGRVKVMDFGLAKLKGTSRLTKTATTVGTLAYMSPEQIQGGEVDARSDLFSFGVVLFEMLTGRTPFRGEHESAVMYSILNEAPEPLLKYRPDAPAEIDVVLEKVLQKDPDNRFQSARQLLDDLKKVPILGRETSVDAGTSIAVLAFEDMSSQKDQDYFCEGLAEEIINSLTKIKALRVSARTSAFAFKGKQVDVRDIGRKLNVQKVLEGSVRKAGDKLRVTAQLINVADGYHAWSERYDRELKDVFEVQDDITANIVQALKLVLSPHEQTALEKDKHINVQAYEYALKARKAFHEQTRKSLANAIEMFQRATELDPGYALAFAGKADCYSFLYQYWQSTPENRREAEEASARALQLNPSLAEAHLSCGLAAMLSKQFDEAERRYTTALTLNPRLFEAHYYFARACFLQGKNEKAIEHFEAAAAINLEDYQAKLLVSSIYRAIGDTAKSNDSMHEGLRRAERYLELYPNDVRALYLGAGAFAQLGDRERGLEWANRALALEPEDPGAFYNIACFYALEGETEKAIDCLENALRHGFAQPEWIEHDTDLDSLRDHPRYQQLLKNMKRQ